VELTFLHLVIIVVTIAVAIGGGLYAARSVKTAEGYSLGGRSSGPIMVAGSIAGTIIGGGATVGTAQLAYSVGYLLGGLRWAVASALSSWDYFTRVLYARRPWKPFLSI
jgi:Na+/proline symporter